MSCEERCMTLKKGRWRERMTTCHRVEGEDPLRKRGMWNRSKNFEHIRMYVYSMYTRPFHRLASGSDHARDAALVFVFVRGTARGT